MLDPPENDGTDMANVVNKPKAEAALKWLGRPGWTPLEQSLRTIFDGIRDGVGSAQDYNYA